MRLEVLALAALLTPLALQDGAQKADPGPEVGKPAPVIRLNDATGRAVGVGGKAERWTVLAFYPKAATPG